MPSALPSYIIEPTRSTADEVEIRADLDRRLAGGDLSGLIIQGLRLDIEPPDLRRARVDGAVFVGCRFASNEVAVDLIRRGAEVVPDFPGPPYSVGQSALYTPETLASGFERGGFAGMFDTVVYRHFAQHGGALPDVREALAQRLHDAGIDDALTDLTGEWTDRHGPSGIVGVMGGHAQPRGSAAYRMAADLGRQVTRAGRVVLTGGGPGVMEAANLGAYLSARPSEELDAAIDALASAPDFHDHDAYTAAALELRAKSPVDGPWWSAGGLSIPTWLYGHEPANLFAARIAKYFSNAIREDTILRLARGGIVFAEGAAGTVQEVFQAATKTYYASDGGSGPYVFLGTDYWTKLPAPDLLRSLLAAAPAGDQSGLVHVTDSVDEALTLIVNSA